MVDIQEIITLFSDNGKLSEHIKGFQPRQEQTDMALLALNAINNKNQCVVEAGTGTGKTFAYLAAAMLSNKKTIVSTGSKNLQDQLFKKDLPTMRNVLGYRGQVALLKGRANYLCLERLDKLISEGVLGDRSVLASLSTVKKWQNHTKSGDLNECSELPEDHPLRPQLVSTTESCLGSDCPNYSECYVLKARKKAMDSDLVVVNHHLFCADMAVKEGGFGELIPNAEVIIFDEAHQLPDIAIQYFSETVSSRQIYELSQDLLLSYRTELKDMKQLGVAADYLQKSAQDLRLAMGDVGQNRRGNLRQLMMKDNFLAKLKILKENLDFSLDVSKLAVGRNPEIDNIYERVITIKNLLTRITETEKTGHCYWYEIFNRHFTLSITPLTVADKFGKQSETHEASWIYTSATLAVENSFDYFCGKLGIKADSEKILNSPFDYPNQAQLCVPRFLPGMKSQDRAVQLSSQLLPIIEGNRGRCFILCTSYSMMRGIAEELREKSQLNVLLQGEKSKESLLQQFVNEKNTVLVATASFWEGIDVRGRALNLVIIDKLPFSAPDDPLLNAQMEDCRLQGGDPFTDIQLPTAVITLKQGVGRLIRDITDQGSIIICDSRLVTKQYGKTFLDSLPSAQRTRDLNKVSEFLKRKIER